MDKYKKLINYCVFGLLLAALFSFAWVGFSSLMMADDYCYFGLTRNEGSFLDVVKNSYTGSVVIAGNRFTSTLLSIVMGGLGAQIVRIMPAIFIFALMLSVCLLIKEATAGAALPGAVPVAAGFFTIILLYLAPSHFQNIYWFSGVVAYSVPIVFFCLLLYLLIKRSQSIENKLLSSIGILILSVITAGFSETSAAAFFTAISLIYAMEIIHKKTNIPNHRFIAAITGMAIGIILLVVSPSAQARNAGMSEIIGNRYDTVFEILAGSLKFGSDFILYQFKGTFLPLAAAFLGMMVAGSFGNSQQSEIKQLVKAGIAIPLIVYLSVSASMAPQIFAFGAYPNERSQFIPLFMLVAGISCAGLLTGRYLSPYIKRYQSLALLALFLCSVYAFRTGLLEINYRSELETRRQQWQVRNQQVLQSFDTGNRDIMVRGIDSIGTISDFNPVCFRSYYQLNSVDVSFE